MSMSETPKSIEEALKGRPGMEQESTGEELIETPTLDETIQEARREAILQAQLDPQIPMLYQTGDPTTTATNQTMTSFRLLTNQEPVVASRESPQPAIGICTEASAEAARLLDPRPDRWPVDMVRLAGYLTGSDFTVGWVESQIRVLSTVPDIVPSPNQWKLPAGVDLPRMVFDVVRTPGWMTQVWPSLRILMGESMGNVQWAAKVLVTLAIFQAVSLVSIFDGTQCG